MEKKKETEGTYRIISAEDGERELVKLEFRDWFLLWRPLAVVVFPGDQVGLTCLPLPKSSFSFFVHLTWNTLVFSPSLW